MTRKGRPRANVPREPNGRAARAAANHNPPLSRLELRRLTDDLAARARLEQFGTPIGQLFLLGSIQPHHYHAARKWDKTAAAYQRAVDAPKPPDSADLLPRSKTTQVNLADKGARAQKLFTVALAFLVAEGKQTTTVVRQCCEGQGRYPAGYDELTRLRQGLSALARLWRLT